MKRSRVVAITATLAALAATGAGAQAASGASPAAGPTKPGATAAANDDIAALAATLGVTTDQLTAAMVSAKMSLVGSTNVTPDAFVTAVAANLELPVPQVQAALEPMFAKRAPTEADKAKPDGDAKQSAEDSPFSTEAAAASLAAALGVDQARAKAALAALVALGSAKEGIDPAAQSFADIAASLGVSPERLLAALSDLKRSLANG
jgi:hypothetical protein